MKNTLKQVALKSIDKAVKMETKQDSSIWFPPCLGILHQPKRPMKK